MFTFSPKGLSVVQQIVVGVALILGTALIAVEADVLRSHLEGRVRVMRAAKSA